VVGPSCRIDQDAGFDEKDEKRENCFVGMGNIQIGNFHPKSMQKQKRKNSFESIVRDWFIASGFRKCMHFVPHFTISISTKLFSISVLVFLTSMLYLFLF
jgi:hypothetical protein